MSFRIFTGKNILPKKLKISYKIRGLKHRGPNNKTKEKCPIYKSSWYYNPLTNEEKRSKFHLEGFVKRRRPKI